MFSLIGAMFYALRQHRRGMLFAGVLPANIAVQIFGITAVLISVLKIILLFNSTSNKVFYAEERNSEKVALWHVGQQLAKKYSGKKLLVILAPDKHADFNQYLRLEGLIEGLDGKLTIKESRVRFEEPKGKRRIKAYTFQNLNDLLLSETGDVDVVITLIGLPMNYYEMPFWSAQDLPDFYSYRGFSWEMDLDIKDGKIDGFITMKPDNRFKGGEFSKAEKSEVFFDRHFLFISSKNIDLMLQKYPALFYRPQDL
jgi:hypothetical protein